MDLLPLRSWLLASLMMMAERQVALVECVESMTFVWMVVMAVKIAYSVVGESQRTLSPVLWSSIVVSWQLPVSRYQAMVARMLAS